MSDLLVATSNPGKLSEFRRLLAHLPARVIGPAEANLALEVPEPYPTYAQNAILKAEAFCRASGLVTLADDSGIEVAALGWGPGARSNRFGGAGVTDRARYMLEQVRGAADRRARMVCQLAVAIPGGEKPSIEVFGGVVEGTLAVAPRGTGGFGYDPIFVRPDGRTNAEVTDAEKDATSHRGLAVAAALPRLRQLVER